MNSYTQSVQPDVCIPVTNPLPRWKRTLDIACSLVALPVLLPLVTVIATITKVSSPGPVLFKQPRVGLRGKQFLCYKFRTMKMNADTTAHKAYLNQLIGSNAPMVKMDASRDSRLIPGGWLLRATGLDELPQIINVLRGEMSLVGPRPCIPYEYENFTIKQKQRSVSVPGLTGLWQVSGKNKTTFSEMIRLDIQYASDKSLWLDLKIMLLTFPALLQQVFETRLNRKAATPAPVAARVFPTTEPHTNHGNRPQLRPVLSS
jgi:lipopolysaccharide/colanic/teichoic acid biosynthesis glycosyltransferase